MRRSLPLVAAAVLAIMAAFSSSTAQAQTLVREFICGQPVFNTGDVFGTDRAALRVRLEIGRLTSYTVSPTGLHQYGPGIQASMAITGPAPGGGQQTITVTGVTANFNPNTRILFFEGMHDVTIGSTTMPATFRLAFDGDITTESPLLNFDVSQAQRSMTSLLIFTGTTDSPTNQFVARINAQEMPAPLVDLSEIAARLQAIEDCACGPRPAATTTAPDPAGD